MRGTASWLDRGTGVRVRAHRSSWSARPVIAEVAAGGAEWWIGPTRRIANRARWNAVLSPSAPAPTTTASASEIIAASSRDTRGLRHGLFLFVAPQRTLPR